MFLGALAIGIVTTQDETQITYQNGTFTLNGLGITEKVSIKPGHQAMNRTTGRLWIPIAGKVCTFDENGVGIRHNNQRSYTGLVSITTSEKLFSQEEQDFINREIGEERRTLDVNAISGWEIVDKSLFLLARWELTNEKTPWLEALVEIDFSKSQPTTTLIGRFDGFSTANSRVDDKLEKVGNSLVVPTINDEQLTIGKYDLEKKELTNSVIGGTINEAKFFPSSRYGFTLTKSAAGTLLIGTFSSDSTEHAFTSEIRGQIFNAYKPSILGYLRSDRKVLLNVMTGAELSLPLDVGIQEAALGILVWAPAENPESAALYNFGGFKTIARFKKE